MSGLLVDVHLDGAELRRRLAEDVRSGLSATPKELPPKWFYDERGCGLFEAITKLPEYYPTRRERSILEARAGEVARLTTAETLVELGSGTSEKTRLLLDALTGVGCLRRFVALDVSEPTVRSAGAAIAADYPGVEVHAVVGDLDHHVPLLPTGGHDLVAFLGGTIGNLRPAERCRLLGDLWSCLTSGDALLIGVDLVKDVGRLERAYDDPAGVTAEFNRNVLRVLNRELGADFVPERFEHVARFDRDNEWMEMSLRSREAHTVTVGDLGLVVPFASGEEVRTEISAKFRRAGGEAELYRAGFVPSRWWTDTDGDFGLSLSFVT